MYREKKLQKSSLKKWSKSDRTHAILERKFKGGLYTYDKDLNTIYSDVHMISSAICVMGIYANIYNMIDQDKSYTFIYHVL